MNNEKIIERVKKEQIKEICKGYDISESELKAECIIDVEECIEKSCQKALSFKNEEQKQKVKKLKEKMWSYQEHYANLDWVDKQHIINEIDEIFSEKINGGDDGK